MRTRARARAGSPGAGDNDGADEARKRRRAAAPCSCGSDLHNVIKKDADLLEKWREHGFAVVPANAAWRNATKTAEFEWNKANATYNRPNDKNLNGQDRRARQMIDLREDGRFQDLWRAAPKWRGKHTQAMTAMRNKEETPPQVYHVDYDTTNTNNATVPERAGFFVYAIGEFVKVHVFPRSHTAPHELKNGVIEVSREYLREAIELPVPPGHFFVAHERLIHRGGGTDCGELPEDTTRVHGHLLKPPAGGAFFPIKIRD